MLNPNTNFSENIFADRRDATTSLDDQLSQVTTLRNLVKLPKASVNVQKRIRFLMDVQVEMGFIIRIMPNFQHEYLYYPSQMCFNSILDGVRDTPIMDGGGGNPPPTLQFCHLVFDNNETW